MSIYQKSIHYVQFITYRILADDGCNTATESSQTNRLLRVFHSCYFHYSEYRILLKLNALSVKLKNQRNVMNVI